MGARMCRCSKAQREAFSAAQSIGAEKEKRLRGNEKLSQPVRDLFPLSVKEREAR